MEHLCVTLDATSSQPHLNLPVKLRIGASRYIERRVHPTVDYTVCHAPAVWEALPPPHTLSADAVQSLVCSVLSAEGQQDRAAGMQSIVARHCCQASLQYRRQFSANCKTRNQ